MKNKILENWKIVKQTKEQRINELGWDLIELITGAKEGDLEEQLKIALLTLDSNKRLQKKLAEYDVLEVRKEVAKDIINMDIAIQFYKGDKKYEPELREAIENKYLLT